MQKKVPSNKPQSISNSWVFEEKLLHAKSVNFSFSGKKKKEIMFWFLPGNVFVFRLRNIS